MLSKEKRLNLKTDFKWVASGKKLETKFLKLFLRQGDNQIPRLGIAVSAKIFKNAAQRNRAKRLTSAVFEKVYPTLPENINIVALPKAGIVEVKSSELLLEVERILRAAGLI